MNSVRVLIVGAVLLGAGSAHAQSTQIAITRNSDVGFGRVIIGSAPGTVTVSPRGFRTASGGASLGSDGGVAPGFFTVSGTPNTAYSIILPSSITISGGTSSMMIDGFTSSPAGSGVLGPSGTQTLSLGATLHLGTHQPGAVYGGLLAVTVAYN